MDIKEYQEKAKKTDMTPTIGEMVISQMTTSNVELSSEEITKIKDVCNTNIYYPTMGLAGEAGEVANKVKKVMRDKGGVITEEFKKDIAKELGDILWYVSTCSSMLGLDLNDIAEANIEKLYSRMDRGVLKGSGDNR